MKATFRFKAVDTICAIEDGAFFDETFFLKKFPGVNGRNR